MSQILTNIEGILKDKYQPALSNLINVEPSPFLEMIRKEPLTNNTVRLAAPIGINGGFGFGAEGLNTPKAGEQRYLDFEIKAVDMYVDIGISHKTVTLGSSNTSAMINALDAEIKGSYAAAKWNLSRALFGDGSGTLTDFHVDGTSPSNSAFVSDTSRLIEGLTVDFMIDGKVMHQARILRIDYANGVIDVDGEPIDPMVCKAGLLVVQGSYNREITGLLKLMTPDGEIYGVSRSKNPSLNPMVITAEGAVTDMFFYRGIRQAAKMRGAKIDLLMMGDDAFEKYQEYMDNHTTHLVDKRKFAGGATGYSILVGDREVIIVNESMVPTDEVWGVDTKSFVLQQTPWEFLSHQGSIFSLQANSSVYRALLASYGNLICENPGGCVRFKNCAQ